MGDCQEAIGWVQVKNDGDWTGVMGSGERWMDSGCILDEQLIQHFDELWKKEKNQVLNGVDDVAIEWNGQIGERTDDFVELGKRNRLWTY